MYDLGTIKKMNEEAFQKHQEERGEKVMCEKDDKDYLVNHVVWVVSRRLEKEAWFKSIPSFLAPTEQQIKAVGIKESTETLERWMRNINK